MSPSDKTAGKASPAPQQRARRSVTPIHPRRQSLGAPDADQARIEFIGTGDAAGTPAAGCDCPICREARFNLERCRTPPCAAFSCGEQAIFFDAGDRDLASKFARHDVLGLLISHFHPGHVHGLEAIASSPEPVQIFGPPGSKPHPSLSDSDANLTFTQALPGEAFELGDALVTPVLLNHGQITYGYCVEFAGRRVGYLCDTYELPPRTADFIAAWKPDALLIDCNQNPDRPSTEHNAPEQAFAIHEHCHPQHSYLMHLGCEVDRWFADHPDALPAGVSLARDGMVALLGSRVVPKPIVAETPSMCQALSPS